MRIGIVGGTFDPFHRGHLEPVFAVRDALGWDRIVYVPAAQQPFKNDRATASGYHRFAMAQLATREHDDVWVTAMELERGGTSYTVDTLEAFHEEHPEAQLDWIIGDDNVADFEKWKDPDRLRELARFVVLSRTGAQDDARFVYARNETVPVSSTEIRRRVRAGEPIDAFVDPLVSRYIHHYGLYKEGES
jgi:nicotinate-nucleotide adenylyltransferase